MTTNPKANFYAQWRRCTGLTQALHEGPDKPPSEQLLQAIWQHQRLLRDQLKTLDGHTVKVLHPGFRNREPGPDFRNAIIQFDLADPIQGDVEVDLRPDCWRAHGHHTNANYRNVVLHVVWEATPDQLTEVQTLPLHGVLDSSPEELSRWLSQQDEISVPENYFGKCTRVLTGLPPDTLLMLLHQAAHIRLQAKAAQFQARARQAGWDQALWEGVFRALGYKHNVWPMHRLAELKPRWFTPGLSAITLQARLLGLAGLLPHEPTRTYPTADKYLRRIWDSWWREREQFSDCILPRAAWQFAGVRPSNHPQRRLALAAHWLSAGSLANKLEQWVVTAHQGRKPAQALLELLHPPYDEFWSIHWTLRSRQLKKPQPLIGMARLTDLAVNVFLPWLWIRAAEGKNDALIQRVEAWYLAWPPATDNAALRLARQRLLGGAPRTVLPDAAAQQGLLQIARDFCSQSDALCSNCRFPELVGAWASTESSTRQRL